MKKTPQNQNLASPRRRPQAGYPITSTNRSVCLGPVLLPPSPHRGIQAPPPNAPSNRGQLTPATKSTPRPHRLSP